MKLQLQPNRWSCLPTSLAILLDIDVARIFDILGHDGGEILWPQFPDPHKRRSFHIQEIMIIAYTLGYYVMTFESDPEHAPDTEVQPHKVKYPIPLEQFMIGVSGIITGHTKHGTRHAVAWNGFKIYDPCYAIYNLDQFKVETFYLVGRLNNDLITPNDTTDQC